MRDVVQKITDTIRTRWRAALLVGVLVVAAGTFVAERPAVATFVWHATKLPGVTLWLDPTPDRAMELANYYFNIDDKGSYDVTRARTYYADAILLSSRNDPPKLAWYQLARIDFIGGHFTAALKAANTQIALFGSDIPNVYYVRGLIFGFMHEYQNAINDFNEYIVYDPTDPWARNDLSWVYFSSGDYQDMLAVSADGLKYAPDHPWLLNMHGLALLNLGRKDEARQYFMKAQQAATGLSISDWGHAYPGNDPRSWHSGLKQMENAITANIERANLD